MTQVPFERIHPDTKPGFVAINSADPGKLSEFYVQVLGLQARMDGGTSSGGSSIRLGSPGGRDIVVLSPVGAAVQSSTAGNTPTTGLYHLAILVPSRFALAQSLRRAIESGWPLDGFADHWVSEAIYLADPEGNGIEIYRDRPRSEWPYQGGQLQMATEPLDVDGVLAELKSAEKQDPSNRSQNGSGSGNADGVAPGTTLGHVHLKVSDIAATEQFYCGVLGFDLVTRYGPSASFVSAGGYHHHIGFNTWSTRGASPRSAETPGLRYFTLRLPSQAELGRLVDRLRAAHLPAREVEAGIMAVDPAGNNVLLAAPPSQEW